MAKPKFKQRCALCKENMVVMYSYKQFPICVKCHMKKIDQPIKGAKFKKLFDIPQKFYEENYFLRNIKEAYIRFDNLTEKQIEAFKKTVKEMKEGKEE
ncbi:MAG: hypothetical protein KKH52_00560 [Nanoarchaeota archaeon]|nr:hypothetical protein [Nanoarchaeota archaeon]MBU1622367.1 hypothetical protein [Nanoarchaeota archaeon]MBU1973867.1 hypothetical protein [Nanoarchaeota archaeon]